MLKKILVPQLRIGMYVHDLECRWLDHPFSTNKFEIRSQQDIQEIKRIGVQSLTIDTRKGRDVELETSEPPASEKPHKSEEQEEPPQRTRLDDELGRAAKVMKQATQVVTSIMEDVRLGKQIELERVNPVVEDMVTSLFSNDGALLGLTRIRRLDKYTFEHSVSVAVLLVAFGKHLGMGKEELIQLGLGGLLQDVGKIKIPAQILNKPGKLTNAEFSIMRKHVVFSRDILKETPGASEVSISIAAEHHERFDGSGYPEGKSGDDISLFGQMAAIVDVYDALGADRVYKKAMSPHNALKKLVEWRQTHLSPELVYNFIHCVGLYPIGTLVQLSDGHMAVVLEQSEQGPLVPRVRVMFDAIKRRFLTPKDLDLSDQHEGKRLEIVGAQEPGKWHITPETYLDHARM